jgi:EpsI family protein
VLNKSAIAYFGLVVLLLATSTLSLNLFFKQRSEHDVVDVREFPLTMGDWRGEDHEITEREYEILETRNLISRTYTDTSGAEAHVFIIYSETNRSVFHPPEVCLIGSGITIVNKTSDAIDRKASSFPVNKLYLKKGASQDIALYCYKSGGLYTDNFYLQQASFTINQVLGKQGGGATIRVMMTVRENEEKTLRALKRFMNEVIDQLEGLQKTS